MYNSLEDINKYLIQHFGNNLVSLIIFGSYSKKSQFKLTSDIDYFIILKKMPEVQSSISRQIKKAIKNCFPLVAFNIYSTQQFKKNTSNNHWLVLSLKEGYDVIVDKDSFYSKSINIKYREIQKTKVGKLAWYLEDSKFPATLIDHYRQASDDLLKASSHIYQKGQLNIALELLLQSIHTFMIGKLMLRKFYITSGEITQLFFNVFADDRLIEYRDRFLELEQSTGQYYSFEFSKNGTMAFNERGIVRNKRLYNSCLKGFELLKGGIDD